MPDICNGWGSCAKQRIVLFLHSLGQWSPTFLAPGTRFVEDNFSMGLRWQRGRVGEETGGGAQVVMPVLGFGEDVASGEMTIWIKHSKSCEHNVAIVKVIQAPFLSGSVHCPIH